MGLPLLLRARVHRGGVGGGDSLGLVLIEASVVTHPAAVLPLQENQVKAHVLFSHFHCDLGPTRQDLLCLISPMCKMIPVLDDVG